MAIGIITKTAICNYVMDKDLGPCSDTDMVTNSYWHGSQTQLSIQHYSRSLEDLGPCTAIGTGIDTTFHSTLQP